MVQRCFIAIGVAFCLVAVGFGQSTSSPALSPALRIHLQAEQFRTVTSIRGFPLGVRDGLQTLFGTATLDIAEPGAEFQRAGAPNAGLPTRRLRAAGCAVDNHCLVYYERGGAIVTQRVALFHWAPSETRFDFGGAAPAGLATAEDVRKAIVSGAIKGGDKGPW